MTFGSPKLPCRRAAAFVAGLALLGPAGLAVAQTPPPSAPLIRPQGAALSLYVQDLEASRRWYAEKLGLQTVMDIPDSGYGAVVILEGGGLLVELVRHRETVIDLPRSSDGERRIRGIFKIGVEIADFDQVIQTLRSRGVEIAFGPFPARPGQRANAIVRDLEGNYIQLFGPSAPSGERP